MVGNDGCRIKLSPVRVKIYSVVINHHGGFATIANVNYLVHWQIQKGAKARNLWAKVCFGPSI